MQRCAQSHLMTAGTIGAFLLTTALFHDNASAGSQRAPAVPRSRLLAAGLREVGGEHITLYTDIPSAPAVDELCRVFDLAVPQWCRFFSIAPARLSDWRMTAYLINHPDKFRSAGVLRANLPPFRHGYQLGPEIWCYEQPSDYYRRHLLLHEGTHAFMNYMLGGAGPPWYMEGMAELLATHRWDGTKLSLVAFPRNREESASWGRIKAVKDDLKAEQGKTLRQIMSYNQRAHLRVEPYAWCWTASVFLNSHPRSRRAFQEMRRNVGNRSWDFSQKLLDQLERDWPFLAHQWQMFVSQIDYGYDVERELFSRKPARELDRPEARVEIVVDRGWQSTGIRIERGGAYRLEASGRYAIGSQPKTWWCEPNGVTINYFNGLPLGMLVATVLDEDTPPNGRSPLLSPQPIGLARQLDVDRDGVLYLRINDSPTGLRDNRGKLAVKVVKETVGE